MNKYRLLNKALSFARKKHEGQFYGEEPFIVHPILTSELLSMVTQDTEIIASGYLHDILEDTDTSLETLHKEFGVRIAHIVFQCTKTDYNTFPNLVDLDAIIVIWASRFANLAHSKNWDHEKMQQYIEKSKFWKT